MHKFSFCVHLLLVAVCLDGMQATRCFFQKHKGDEHGETSYGLPLFDPELFRCGRSSDCLYVGRKGREFTSISKEKNADSINSFDEVWKKVEIAEISGKSFYQILK